MTGSRRGIRSIALALTIALLILSGHSPSVSTATPSVLTQAGIHLTEVDPSYLNPWTAALEAEFQQRAATVIQHFANGEDYGTTWGENEKRSYPAAMFDFLAGNRQKALTFLQQDDSQREEQAHTDYIDYYFCFTLKGQIRKYFLLGPYLDPAYRQRMYNAAKIWTEQDPLSRPHPIYGTGRGTGKDWSMARRGLWVDSRNTDNLRAMRETSVYLMAEETGNEATRQIYQRKIQRYVGALYHIGMGEWDSDVYHGHTFAAYLNLYDFAKDPEVKQLAKAALDWLSMAAAVKYYRGGWGGPVKRDYGGSNEAMRSDAVRTFWLYYGDTPLANADPTRDSFPLITSRYRPPLAAVAIARKDFAKPVEILAAKPVYENWKPGKDERPGYWETQFIGHHYQMGSLAGHFADGDVAPFKVMTENATRGVDFFVANTGGKWVQPGKNPGDQIGQYRNLLLWLRPADRSFFFQLPQTARVEIEGDIWFVRLEKTWLAMRSIDLQSPRLIPIVDRHFADIYRQAITYQALPQDGRYAGFALEVGEVETHGSYENFKSLVREKSQLDLTKLNQGTVSLKGTTGETLQLTHNRVTLLPILLRNGQFHDWSQNFALYRSLSFDRSPVDLGWQEGTLRIKAGGYEFSNSVPFPKGLGS